MRRLTKQAFWDARHEVTIREHRRRAPARHGIRRFLDHARIRFGAEPHATYSTFLMENVLRTHLPRRSDWSSIEVGCAPGRNLIRLNQLFGYQPYGVEYTAVGAEATRATFAAHGFPTENVVASDFFAPEFQSRYRCHFDVVLSHGFIEHFDCPAEVVAAHLALLRVGGYLICSVPNLLGPAYPFLRLFAVDQLTAHNCEIMRLRPFRALFERLALETQWCGYVGQFAFFGLSVRHERSFRGGLARLLNWFADISDHSMFVALHGRAFETSWSPYLLYVGRKRQ
jgi:SAM-dependent methyltransferase